MKIKINHSIIQFLQFLEISGFIKTFILPNLKDKLK